MKAFCISHVKDVDGLGAAAIVKAATGADFLLSDYDDLLADLGKVPKGADEFVLCDLGADNSNREQFVKAMRGLAKRTKVTYIDHHYLSPATKRSLKAAGVKLVHDDRECSSMLAYLTFEDRLPQGGSLVALCGAVTDYMDGSPHAAELMEQADRQYVLLEAAMLSFALGKMGTSGGFPQLVVTGLASMKAPHEIEGVPGHALEQLAAVEELAKAVRREGRKLGRLAYMPTRQYSTGNVAKLLIGAFGVPVGVAYKEKQPGWYEVSLRGTSECRVHLGRTVDKIAGGLGGSGGGHRLAAGCRVSVERVDALIAGLAKKV